MRKTLPRSPGVSFAILFSLLLLAPAAVLSLEAPPPIACDIPDDWGKGLTVMWEPPSPEIERLELWRKITDPERPALPAGLDSTGQNETLSAAGWEMVAEPSLQDTTYLDSGLDAGEHYSYLLLVEAGETTAVSEPSTPLAPATSPLRTRRINILVAVFAFMAAVIILVERARRGAGLFIRRIAGLEAVEEAVGRATEMGRPVLYVPGLDPMDEVGTVAAVDILGQVAKKTAQYETKLMVPNRDPIVMAVAQQVVRESYSAVGKPQLYREENVFYVTYSQFGFAAAVAGLMIREKPATNFFMGRFYAESLVLAETGNATGAIQIAGTDSDAQLPFFIAACDYTLIGEELYAGAVYLSRQPLMLGALKGQDYAKALIIAAILVGIVLSMISPEAAETFRAAFN
jgi:hypothetical protein